MLTQNCATTYEFSAEGTKRILTPNNDMERTVSTEDLKVKLERLFIKETRLLSHGAALSEYRRNRKIPRGLHIQKSPTTGKQELYKETGKDPEQCSLDLMLLSTEASELKSEISAQEEGVKQRSGVDF